MDSQESADNVPEEENPVTIIKDGPISDIESQCNLPIEITLAQIHRSHSQRKLGHAYPSFSQRPNSSLLRLAVEVSLLMVRWLHLTASIAS